MEGAKQGMGLGCVICKVKKPSVRVGVSTGAEVPNKEESWGRGTQAENSRCPDQKGSLPVDFKKHPRAQVCVLG